MWVVLCGTEFYNTLSLYMLIYIYKYVSIYAYKYAFVVFKTEFSTKNHNIADKHAFLLLFVVQLLSRLRLFVTP